MFLYVLTSFFGVGMTSFHMMRSGIGQAESRWCRGEALLAWRSWRLLETTSSVRLHRNDFKLEWLGLQVMLCKSSAPFLHCFQVWPSILWPDLFKGMNIQIWNFRPPFTKDRLRHIETPYGSAQFCPSMTWGWNATSDTWSNLWYPLVFSLGCVGFWIAGMQPSSCLSSSRRSWASCDRCRLLWADFAPALLRQCQCFSRDHFHQLAKDIWKTFIINTLQLKPLEHENAYMSIWICTDRFFHTNMQIKCRPANTHSTFSCTCTDPRGNCFSGGWKTGIWHQGTPWPMKLLKGLKYEKWN